MIFAAEIKEKKRKLIKKMLVEAPSFCCYVDDETTHVFLDKEKTRKITFWRKDRYFQSGGRYLHRIIADALVVNPRPDLFNIVDHIDGDVKNNRPENLRHCNSHLNNLSQQKKTRGVFAATIRKQKLWGYRKTNAILRYFKTKEQADGFAREFNPAYFNAVLQVYLDAPHRDALDFDSYIEKKFIPIRNFAKGMRPEVLGLKRLVVGNTLFNRLTNKCPECPTISASPEEKSSPNFLCLKRAFSFVTSLSYASNSLGSSVGAVGHSSS